VYAILRESLELVRQFHAAMNAPISSRPTLLDCNKSAAASLAEHINTLVTKTISNTSNDDVLLLRATLALEELAEWLTAHSQQDLVAAADAWADRAFILIGDAVASGLPVADLFAEVHRSNMTKEACVAGSGKAVKGNLYQPPSLSSLLK